MASPRCGTEIAPAFGMTKLKPNNGEGSPRGPEGVPVDAPGNTAPAISPHAVSRMSRAEDDDLTQARSPEFTDQTPTDPAASAPDATTPTADDGTRWRAGAPGSGGPDDAARGLDGADMPRPDQNPSHGTTKDAATTPRSAYDGELREQPDSQHEARQPGPDDPGADR